MNTLDGVWVVTAGDKHNRHVTNFSQQEPLRAQQKLVQSITGLARCSSGPKNAKRPSFSDRRDVHGPKPSDLVLNFPDGQTY